MKEVIINTETGETSERDFTAKEIKAAEKAQAEATALQAEYETKKAADAEAKAALLAQLGITEEQAKLLLS